MAAFSLSLSQVSLSLVVAFSLDARLKQRHTRHSPQPQSQPDYITMLAFIMTNNSPHSARGCMVSSSTPAPTLPCQD